MLRGDFGLLDRRGLNRPYVSLLKISENLAPEKRLRRLFFVDIVYGSGCCPGAIMDCILGASWSAGFVSLSPW